MWGSFEGDLFRIQPLSAKRLRNICGKGVMTVSKSSSRSTLIRVPLPSSTLFLSIDEAISLLGQLEDALPHSNHFEIAGEVLSKGEMQALLLELKVMLVGGERMPRGEWRKGFWWGRWCPPLNPCQISKRVDMQDIWFPILGESVLRGISHSKAPLQRLGQPILWVLEQVIKKKQKIIIICKGISNKFWSTTHKIHIKNFLKKNSIGGVLNFKWGTSCEVFNLKKICTGKEF